MKFTLDNIRSLYRIPAENSRASKLTTEFHTLLSWRLINSSPFSSPPNSNHAISFPVRLRFHTISNIILRPRVISCSILTHCATHPVKMANSPSNSSSDCTDYAEIIVVRHGETEWNADGRIQGHIDVELNEVGRRQAISVAVRLSKEPKISAVYSSDLKRAIVTAETIAASCGGLEVIQDAELRERNLGILQGLKLQEAAGVSPEAYQAFLCRRTNQDIPGGGESLDQLYQRSTSFLQRIARKHIGERVVVVTHGGVIRALYKRACPNKKPMGKVLNTSVNIFHIFGEKKWTLSVCGDVSHLKQTEYLDSGFGGDRTSG